MASEKKPAIIFIDEIDAICRTRSDDQSEAERRIKTEFLTCMQGMLSLFSRSLFSRVSRLSVYRTVIYRMLRVCPLNTPHV